MKTEDVSYHADSFYCEDDDAEEMRKLFHRDEVVPFRWRGHVPEHIVQRNSEADADEGIGHGGERH